MPQLMALDLLEDAQGSIEKLGNTLLGPSEYASMAEVYIIDCSCISLSKI